MVRILLGKILMNRFKFSFDSLFYQLKICLQQQSISLPYLVKFDYKMAEIVFTKILIKLSSSFILNFIAIHTTFLNEN